MKWWKSLSSSLVLAIALSAGSAAGAEAQMLYGGISVDASVVAARQGAPLAAQLSAALTGELRHSFADRVTKAKGAPSLVVRVTRLSMGDQPEGWRLGGGNTAQDSITGEALTVAPNGRVIASYPMLAVLPSSYAGAWYRPDSEARRVQAIAGQYAAWLRHELAVQ